MLLSEYRLENYTPGDLQKNGICSKTGEIFSECPSKICDHAIPIPTVNDIIEKCVNELKKDNPNPNTIKSYIRELKARHSYRNASIDYILVDLAEQCIEKNHETPVLDSILGGFSDLNSRLTFLLKIAERRGEFSRNIIDHLKSYIGAPSTHTPSV